jgi:hypothetical protein
MTIIGETASPAIQESESWDRPEATSLSKIP